MITLENEYLSKHTTFRIGGLAKKYYIPCNYNELLDLLESIPKNEKYYIISGGSNLLINDQKVFDHVISCEHIDENIIDYGNGSFYVGASVRIQKLIRIINEKKYGGIEFLYSLPAMVGGIIVMNAGRGKGWNQSISNNVISVNVYKEGKIVSLSKEQCNFEYRTSIFKGSDMIVLGVTLQFESIEPEKAKAIINDRIENVNKTQDRTKPNFGSVFYLCNPKIMRLIMKIGLGRKKKIHYSNKTENWLINEYNGDFKEAKFLIIFVKIIHKVMRRPCEVEVQIWD